MAKRPPSSNGTEPSDTAWKPSKRQQTQDPRDADITALQRLADEADNLIENANGLVSTLQQLQQCDTNDMRSQNTALLGVRKFLAGLGESITLLQSQLPPETRHLGLDVVDAAHPRLPPMDCVTPWRSSELSQQLPPLPTVKDKKLEELAFTHPGIVPGSSPDKQYEKLEWVGDAYLELFATLLIYNTFPKLSSGRSSQMRERLIRNTTLATYFREYGLESKARLPRDVLHQKKPARGSSSDKDLLKTQGDMFEAYVAALILSDPTDGMTSAVDWLKALWGRAVIDDVQKAEQAQANTRAITTENAEHRQRTPKEELSSRIVVKGIALRYEKAETKKKADRHLGQELFTVNLYLDGWGETGKILGWGSALNVKEAGQKAAMRALENKKLIKVYEGKKKAFMEAKSAAV